MTTNVLVTGGAGYIGSFMVRVLRENGYQPIVLDDLSRSDKSSVPDGVPFFQGRVSDKDILSSIQEHHPLAGIIHFAGYISMKESMEQPAMYFEANTFETLRLVENMRKIGVNNIIFSSTAGVYGNPERVPIPHIWKNTKTC
jgi:UDP-glucose 4-epimerase